MIVPLLLLSACSGPVERGAAAPAAAKPDGLGRPVQTSGGTYHNLNAAELRTMLERKDFVLVDTHVPHEGRLRQTDARIAYTEIGKNLGLLPAAKDAKIVLYCMSGRMSQIAAERLVALGYTNVWNLERGMNDWRGAGYELLAD